MVVFHLEICDYKVKNNMEILEKYGIVEAGKDYAWFDCESFEESEAYIELIKNLSTISKSKFSPQNLIIENEGWTENREHYIVEINFTMNIIKSNFCVKNGSIST